MVQTIEQPAVPFVGPIKGGLDPGTMIRIQGQVPSDGDRFNINLHCGSPPSDIALHVSVRLLQSYIARNSFEDGEWGKEEDSGNLTIAPGEHFEILILCDPTSYKIAVNGNHFGEFQHRIPFNGVSHLKIDGTVAIGLIAFESAMAPPPPPPQRMGDGGEMPPGYGPPPPPRDNFGYGPPPPQGPFGGGPGRYPHQRGEDGESGGFESFLGNAGSAIAGVMVSGLAENLLGGLTGQSQRHPPSQHQQNPMYNDGGHHRQGGGSIIDDLLGSLTGGGAQSRPPQSHSPMYNQGGQQQQQQGGSTIVSDILGSLANEMFKPSRRSRMPNQPFGGPGSTPFGQPLLLNQIPFVGLPQRTNDQPPFSNQISFVGLPQQINCQPPPLNQIPNVPLPQQTNAQSPPLNQIPNVPLPQQTVSQPPPSNQNPLEAFLPQINLVPTNVRSLLPPHLQNIPLSHPEHMPGPDDIPDEEADMEFPSDPHFWASSPGRRHKPKYEKKIIIKRR
ncbi:hypothetical protein FQR65_LT04203 [Abscondita terminalis]|nr:hypothetical protein FQR65_LT04203 [Abscondita terminalis]